jgi:hypothetical protein
MEYEFTLKYQLVDDEEMDACSSAWPKRVVMMPWSDWSARSAGAGLCAESSSAEEAIESALGMFAARCLARD